MQIENFKIFADLVETKSFSKAAKINGITQSAVSQQARAMERHFKTLLIDRSQKQFQLTREGQRVYEASKEVLHQYDKLLSELTTSPEHAVEVGNRTLQFHTTNRLVRSPAWDIMLQKTGYISEAGQCLVMSAKVAGRKLIMVFLDSAGKLSRIGDAERVRKWVETHSPTGVPLPAAGGNTVIRQVNG